MRPEEAWIQLQGLFELTGPIPPDTFLGEKSAPGFPGVMTDLTRRLLLQRLSLTFAGLLVDCQKRDWFEQELVCIHIFNPRDSLPAPLLEKVAHVPRRSRQDYFQIGLPELILCTTETEFLDMFQYFWPFSRSELEQLQNAIRIEFQTPIIAGTTDVKKFTRYLREHYDALTQAGRHLAVFFTFNEFTRYWTSAVIAACRGADVGELIIFKDPSRPPYLCDYPSRQKGFKRPPP